jgi:hypothetical protein
MFQEKSSPETYRADWNYQYTDIFASNWLSILFLSMMNGETNIK